MMRSKKQRSFWVLILMMVATQALAAGKKDDEALSFDDLDPTKPVNPEPLNTPLDDATKAPQSGMAGKPGDRKKPMGTAEAESTDANVNPVLKKTGKELEGIDLSDDIPSDVKELEDRYKTGIPMPGTESDDPGAGLPPTLKFSRVPLRPRMSDQTWKRFAGTQLQKIYRIRRGDTLWGISERLFGNSFLWPKVWQLNANLTNPNVVDPGIELSFRPSNPRSGPQFAFVVEKVLAENDEIMPLMVSNRNMDMLEMIDATIRLQLKGPTPPFQFFLADHEPRRKAFVPRPDDAERIYMTQGQTFTVDLEPGFYNVVRVESSTGTEYGVASLHKLRWVGQIEIVRRRAKILRSFSEIREGDWIVDDNFLISPLALHDEYVGPKERDSITFVPVQEGAESNIGQYHLIGMKFKGSSEGPQPGSIMTISRDRTLKVGTVVLLNRSGAFGTAWVVESDREIRPEDQVD